MGPEHLESPERITIIEKALKEASFKSKFIEARRATDEEILTVHSQGYLDTMYRSTGIARIKMTEDTSTNMFTLDAALTSAGGGIQMVENSKHNHGFSLLRPPGHHATQNAAMGFCFFNNIAIAANAIRDKYKKILILDIDQHFGNGTADIFKDDPDVLYMSLHADPQISYPGTGFASNVGIKEGLGKTVNISLPWKLKDSDYLVALDEIAIPISEQFNPDIILLSLGVDGLEDDPYGHLSLTTDVYYEIGRRIGDFNKRNTNNKVPTFFEGGYKYDLLGEATVKFFEGLLNPDGEERIKAELTPKFSYQLRKIKSIQRKHWIGI